MQRQVTEPVERGWSHGEKVVLTRSGRCEFDKLAVPDYRFTLDEALALARQQAATLRIDGYTAAEILNDHIARGCPA